MAFAMLHRKPIVLQRIEILGLHLTSPRERNHSDMEIDIVSLIDSGQMQLQVWRMSVAIRRPNTGDIERLEQLYQEYMRVDGSRMQALRSAIEGVSSLMCVAEAEGEVVGLIHQIFYVDPLHAGECSSILFLYVAEVFRERGVASLLLKAALSDASERGIIEVHVSTRADNLIAIELYRSLGFEYAGPLFEHNPCEKSSPAAG